MAKSQSLNYWAEIEAGFRGSTLLQVGTLLGAVGALANLGADILGGADGPSQPVTIIAWLLFIAGLWLLAGGFILVGSHRTLTKFAIFVGIFHGLQGIQLLTVLFTFSSVPLPPISLTVGRLIAVLIFIFLERHFLPVQTRNLLYWAVGCQLAKVTSRALGLLPAMNSPVSPLVDTVFLLFLAAALMQLGVFVRQEEDAWARQVFDSGHSDFADFNNPQHEWNQRAETKNQRQKTKKSR